MRYLWVLSFLLLVTFLGLGPRLFSSEPPADEELVIISPHWDGVRREFGRAFSEWYLQKTGKRIHVEWLDVGATGEIRKFLDERFAQAQPGEGIGTDILFGGGMDILPGLAEKKFLQAVALPPELEREIPDALNGQPIKEANRLYYAACLSGYGFVYNKFVIEKAKLPAPKTWEDLGAPAYRGWVSCGDPGRSGSLHMVFEVILQGEGFERGWGTVARMLANVRAFNEGGTSIPRDVSLGQAAAGPCIDFYARAPIRRQGATHLEFVVPEGLAVVTPDGIAILRDAPHAAAAREFLYFVMSEAGQRLWYQARGSAGGPVDYDLERLPVMPKIYQMDLPTHTVVRPFEAKTDFQYDGRKGSSRWSLLNDLWRAVIIDTHEDLWEARAAVIAAHRDADLGHALVRPPLTEKELSALLARRLTTDQRNGLRNRWSAWARAWYAQIADAARRGTPPPAFVPPPGPDEALKP